jgi:hypothetical protein
MSENLTPTNSRFILQLHLPVDTDIIISREKADELRTGPKAGRKSRGLHLCTGKISGAGGAAEILKIPGKTLHAKTKS